MKCDYGWHQPFVGAGDSRRPQRNTGPTSDHTGETEISRPWNMNYARFKKACDSYAPKVFFSSVLMPKIVFQNSL